MTRSAGLALGLALAGAGLLAWGAWIPAKAALAQLLLQRAWRDTLAGGTRHAPWPWADTRPVARLRVPALGVDAIVLAGATGRTLAFGPGHVSGSAAPGADGNSVLTGHRDTHFAFLRRLAPGDAIDIDTADGRTHRYRVVAARRVDERRTGVLASGGVTRLTLITCYPFDSPLPGGPLRYVVTARYVAAPDDVTEAEREPEPDSPAAPAPRKESA